MKRIILLLFATHFLWAGSVTARANEAVMPFSGEADSYERPAARIFPLLGEKARARGKKLPPPFGVMYVTNWMDSDWEFESAAVGLGGSNPISIDAVAQNTDMNLQIQTNGVKADLWVLPFMDLMVGAGRVDVQADLTLRDVPVYFDLGNGFVYGDKLIPMEFSGDYYSFGTVLAGAYKRLYGAMDMSWVKTRLNGNASLSADGFWTFTAAPKLGYNAGLSQIYIGARYISKNERYAGTVPLASGDDLSFDVRVKTASWVGNFGMRTIIRERWEIFMESALGRRYQITGGVGYRW